MQPSLRIAPANLVPEAAALGISPPPRRGAASLVRPPLTAPELAFGRRNPASAAALLGASSLPQGGVSALGNLDREGLGANPASIERF